MHFLVKWLPVTVICASWATCAFAGVNDLHFSGKNADFDHPSVITGFNKKTGIVTGTISFVRTAPGQTDECRILFASDASRRNTLNIRFFDVGMEQVEERYSSASKAAITPGPNGAQISIAKNSLVRDCDWVLAYIGEPAVREQGKALLIAVPARAPGDWNGVYVIKTARAYFHKTPDIAQRQNAFLVSGDTIYVHDEKPGWYLASFQGRSKQTRGWIKQSDTVQF
jgi:hypothetical protein